MTIFDSLLLCQKLSDAELLDEVIDAVAGMKLEIDRLKLLEKRHVELVSSVTDHAEELERLRAMERQYRSLLAEFDRQEADHRSRPE